MLRLRYASTPGSSLAYSVERLADGLLFDFGDATFKSSPGTATALLPEGTGIFAGRYALNLATPTGQWTDGNYCVTVHDAANANQVVDELVAVLYQGDDAPAPPAVGGTGGTDPWATALPGSYAAGTAGAILGGSFAGGISLAQLRTELDARDLDATHLARLDAAVSTRSTYAGADTPGTATALALWNGLTDAGDRTRFTAHALALAPATGGGGSVTVAGYATGQDPASLLAAAGYTAGRALKLDNLDAAVSTRSTYAGGPVVLSAAGLDAVAVESGLNARQAFQVAAAVLCGTCAVSVSGTTATLSFRAAGGTAPRVVLTADVTTGVRSAVTLSPT